MIYEVRMSNEAVLKMYYATNHKYINVKNIQLLFGCGYQKAAKIRDTIQKELTEEGEKFPLGYVPFERVLEKAHLSISTIERNYKKQKSLNLN